ncbi:MAG: U32 family peptidase [Oscillospiraceae bacterium]|nr:U32 family peptidase [Oscillospiraceae bacterium]
MLELLAPAGSFEAVIAAVQNGADAVYLGMDAFNARRGAKNFTEEALARAAEYCHVRGVKVYVTLNTLVTDRELHLVERVAKTVSRAGADAVIVQDLGVIRVIQQALPEMPIHASTQMSIHNLDGVRRAKELGAKRVILGRELSMAHIAYIAQRTDMEIEVFAHGALCMCYSGQCYMSAAIGARSGNRGLCAQPCRLDYSLDGIAGAYLSLKDLSLVDHLETLETCGVTSLKLEGRMKRPEYVAVVTRIYSELMQEMRGPTEGERKRLAEAFSREGFTDAYFKGEKGPEMMGVRTEENKRTPRFFDGVKKDYSGGEYQRVPLRFYAMIQKGQPIRLAASDEDGNVIRSEGPYPEAAITRAVTAGQIEASLVKTGGTPYFVQDVQVLIDPDLSVSAAQVNELRRETLAALTLQRATRPDRSEGIFRAGDPPPKREEPPQLNVSLLKAGQLTAEFLDLRPSLIYLPLGEILEQAETLRPYLEREGIRFSAILPQIIWDNERDEIKKQLFEVQALGITECLVGNMGHIEFAKKAGLTVRGDFGLNVFNAETLASYGAMGLQSATASFELKLAQIRDMGKAIDLELLAYGRLPLMITENCVLKNAKGDAACESCERAETVPLLTDRMGAAFPVIRETNCRNVILNSRKLFLADKAENYMDIGLWGVRLAFTTENSRECCQVLERYLELGNYEPGEFTRGLYTRGVE